MSPLSGVRTIGLGHEHDPIARVILKGIGDERRGGAKAEPGLSVMRMASCSHLASTRGTC